MQQRRVSGGRTDGGQFKSSKIAEMPTVDIGLTTSTSEEAVELVARQLQGWERQDFTHKQHWALSRDGKIVGEVHRMKGAGPNGTLQTYWLPLTPSANGRIHYGWHETLIDAMDRVEKELDDDN